MMYQTFYRYAKSFTVGFVAVAFLATGCTKNKKEEYGLDIRETLRINIDTEPPTLDWTKAVDTTSSIVLNNIMEGLVDYDMTGSEPKLTPGLAEKWESSEKAKTWTFHIRKGIKWKDGVELTAQHFIDGWERLLNPKTGAEYAYFLYGVKNAKNYYDKKITDFSKVGIKAEDPYTLVVTLEQPASFFPHLMTHTSTYPLRKEIIEKFGDKWTAPENIVTLGAYNLKVWEHDKALVLERNETYYGTKPLIKDILAYMITEASTALNLYESGKLDSQHVIPSADLAKYSKRPDFKSVPSLILQYYGFNTSKKPFDNPNVRKAIASAIDRQEIVGILAGGQIPLMSWIPVGMMGYEASVGMKFNIEKAKEYLAKAGFSDPKKFPRVTIGLNTNDDHKRIAENVQAQLKRNLGIDVEIQNEEWKVYLKKLQVDPPSIYRMGWQADYPDPDNFMNLMTSYSKNNNTRWKNPAYDKLIENAVSEVDSEKRKGIYDRAQKLLTEDDVPTIPLYSAVSQKLVAPRVVNYPLNSMDRLVYKYTSLKAQ